MQITDVACGVRRAVSPKMLRDGGPSVGVAVAMLERPRRHNRQKLQRREEVRKARRALLLPPTKHVT